MAEITAEAEAKYIEAGGLVCPFCGGDQIEGDSWGAEGGTAWQEVKCLECDEKWYDLYELKGVERR